MSEQTLNQLLVNEWEFYNAKKLHRTQAKYIIPLTVLMIGLSLFIAFAINWLLIEVTNEAINLQERFLIAAFIMLFYLVRITLNHKRLNRSKKDWYFSGIIDDRLERENMLNLIRKVLEKYNYSFYEETTKKSSKLWITYFDLSGTDFNVRLMFTILVGIKVAEIGLGPRTIINRNILEQLKTDFSKAAVELWGEPEPSVDGSQPGAVA